jgi:hypothetical protein
VGEANRVCLVVAEVSRLKRKLNESEKKVPPSSLYFSTRFLQCTALVVWHAMQGTERLAKANRLKRDFEREVMNPKYICPVFTLPDGKTIDKATDKEEHTAQLEDQLKRT